MLYTAALYVQYVIYITLLCYTLHCYNIHYTAVLHICNIHQSVRVDMIVAKYIDIYSICSKGPTLITCSGFCLLVCPIGSRQLALFLLLQPTRLFIIPAYELYWLVKILSFRFVNINNIEG